MSELMAANLPVWIICGILGVQFGVKLKGWAKNGTSNGHCQLMRMFADDPPRQTTKLLEDIHREICGVRSDFHDWKDAQ